VAATLLPCISHFHPNNIVIVNTRYTIRRRHGHYETCLISGYRRKVGENCVLLGCYAA
jgi:hypothetical protein